MAKTMGAVETMKPTVTAVLLSWKRAPNMPGIVQALRSQAGVDVKIMVINNGEQFMETFGADYWVGISPWNAGEWARYVFAGRVETDYCMFQDDDFMLGDDTFLKDAIEIHAEKCPNHILGTAGRGLQYTPPYYSPDIAEGYAAIMKGHFQLFKPEIVRRAHIPQKQNASDIYWSLDLGQGQRCHYVSERLRRRLIALDQHGVGLEFRPNHYQGREAVCKEWIKEFQHA